MKIFFVCLFITLSSPVVSGTVETAQRYLNILGYDAGSVDGLYGGKTKRALTAFFADRGLEYDGVLDAAEVSALLDKGFSGDAAKKSSAYKPKKILPTRPTVFDEMPCIDTQWTKNTNTIQRLVTDNDFIEMAAFAENEEAYFDVIERVESFLSKTWGSPTQQNLDQAKTLMRFLFDNDFSLKPKNKKHSDSLMTKHFLSTAMYIYAVLEKNGNLTPAEKLDYLAEIDKRFWANQNVHKSGFTMSLCKVGGELFDCQNHTYGHQHVRTMYGALFNDVKHYAMGEKLFKFAIDDLSRDGALWREASRSKNSWGYYGHAMGHLLSIAEIYRLNGDDLYSYVSPVNGYTIHDAVAFYLDALRQPEKMWAYAEWSSIHETDREGFKDYKNLELRDRVLSNDEKGGLKNWYYIYRSVFPDHANTALAETLIPTFQEQMSSSNNLGYFAQCIYKSPAQEVGSSF